MGRTTRMEYSVIIRIGMVVTAWLFWAAVCSQIGHAVFRFPVLPIDGRATELMTSIDYRYQNLFDGTLNRYRQFDNMYLDEFSTAIPGLSYTSLTDSASRHMVPQGVCFAGDYMLITAYDSTKKENSVVYVLSNQDKTNRTFLTTLVLPDQNHVGGIAFDGEYIWVAKSLSGYISALPYELVEEAVASESFSFPVEAYAWNLYCGVPASFVSYYDERLWVGTYRSPSDGMGALQSYRLNQEGSDISLQWESTIQIPSCAQGAAFLEEDDQTYLLLTTSRGRHSDSNVYLYEMYETEAEPLLIERGSYIFPPMAEELVTDGTYTYVLFESAATCYSTSMYNKCLYPVDRVSALSNRQLLGG